MASSEGFEDAVIVIQQASAAIVQAASKITGNNEDVVAVLKDLTNKVDHLQSVQRSSSTKPPVKPTPYIKASKGLYVRTILIVFSGPDKFRSLY